MDGDELGAGLGVGCFSIRGKVATWHDLVGLVCGIEVSPDGEAGTVCRLERVTILNTEFWLLKTALAKPTKEVLQTPHSLIVSIRLPQF
jgi:hypothetical protein